MSPTSEGRTARQPRRVLLTVHTGRRDIVALARSSAARLQESGIVVRLLDDEARDLEIPGAEVVPADEKAAHDTEIVMVFGGDGTFLRAAELACAPGESIHNEPFPVDARSVLAAMRTADAEGRRRKVA